MPNKHNIEIFLTILSILIGLLSLFRDLLGFETSAFNLVVYLKNHQWLIFLANAIAFSWIGYFFGTKIIKKQPVNNNSCGAELITTTDGILNSIKDDTSSSFKSLFKGWFAQLTSEIKEGGDQIFDIDSNYYANCLIEIETDDVCAIADLTNPVENFWLENPNPNNTKVKERIFLLDWKVFFNNSKLEKYIRIFRTNRQLYDVRVGHAPLRISSNLHHFENRIGSDLFIGKQHLVGGYISKNNRTLLRMVRNERTYKEALSKYKNFREDSFEFKIDWNVNDLRKAWLEHNKIGHWANWGEIVENRTIDYFENYDLHIRCWIPRYDDFIEGCFNLIRKHTLQLFRGSTHRLKILEIGFGTGALTKYILDWIHQFDKPFEGTPNSIYYCGMDPARNEMFANTNYQINSSDKDKYFFTGSAFDAIHEKVKHQAPFDIICASLVLHDLNTEFPNINFPNQLKQFSHLLKDGGRVIIADLFGTTDKIKHAERFKYWKDFLNSNLSKDATEIFLNKNKDMVNCIKEETVKTLSEQHGFKAEFQNVPIGERISPFKYLILTKISNFTASK